MKHYKSVEFLSIFRLWSPPAQTQRSPFENFPGRFWPRSELLFEVPRKRWKQKFVRSNYLLNQLATTQPLPYALHGTTSILGVQQTNMPKRCKKICRSRKEIASH